MTVLHEKVEYSLAARRERRGRYARIIARCHRTTGQTVTRMTLTRTLAQRDPVLLVIFNTITLAIFLPRKLLLHLLNSFLIARRRRGRARAVRGNAGHIVIAALRLRSPFPPPPFTSASYIRRCIR